MNASIGKYLILYNIIQLLGWISIIIALLFFPEKLFYLLCIVQTIAVAEIIHAFFKWIKSNFFYTFLQIGARLLILVFVVQLNLQNGLSNPNFSFLFPIYKLMVLVWCIAEIIRSSYYLKKDSKLITWLRYNAFILCYPIGVASELYLVYCLLVSKSKLSMTIALILLFVTYLIAFPSLYLHLLKQRKSKFS